MSAITTHVLDTARGCPAAGIPVTLERLDGDWQAAGSGTTNADGRVADLLAPGNIPTGTWRITFDLSDYQEGFYPYAAIAFRVEDGTAHYHVPLLLSPYGYSTYRGS
ncbi:MAG: hydroxyisourate hydrolase [Myxococcota bacterium]|nr:hydroxyisourate hydrolase [Myxococcota bacterium]